MSRVFICSDLHLGHANMAIRYRGFEDEFHHDETIINNWNSVVNKRDKVFVLGDITMESQKKYHLLKLLNGNKVFVLGNHDKTQDANGLIKYGNVAGMIKYKGYWLTHAPIHPSELRGKINIHGHIHNNIIMDGNIPDKRYINVCMDRINHTPILFDELITPANNAGIK